MYNDSIDKIFPFLKQQNKIGPFPPENSREKYSFIIHYMVVIWYETKKRKWKDRSVLYINRWNKGVENKTGILYNDIVGQLKGM